MATYLRPGALDEALEALAARPLVVLAGGTDHYPARVGQPPGEAILDITGLRDLEGIEERDDHFRIGAVTRWATLRDADLPPWFDALRLAAREVGGPQVQNAGTIGGNLCNASPAADAIPPLLALGAEVELAGRDGSETLPLGRFILGNRRTACRPDQLLTAVRVPKPATARAGSHFLKLGARRHLVISIVMAAAALEIDEQNVIQSARVAIGACSPVALRLPLAEAALAGASLNGRVAERIERRHLAALAPIDDVRADAAYRLEAALVLVRRTVASLAERW